ncbi:hypothetical protein B4114_1158 [Geobacillus stearothermophilus]|uniref:Uncharacterized protein n=1 Tax=Geobacillus stearothermophilus TaxID=1422 RepID=A0A150NBJ1_GEOSE|nr:hypothetical protein B4114_1158 [Geobacillus stearothermophilus]
MKRKEKRNFKKMDHLEKTRIYLHPLGFLTIKSKEEKGAFPLGAFPGT